MTSSGTVQAVSGIVKAIAIDGATRTLKVGDEVLPNEKIITDGAGAISIEFSDGTLMDLGRNDSITLNDESLNPEGITKQVTAADAQDEVAAIQQALVDEETFDPSKLEAPSAGNQPATGGSEDEGNSIVNVEYLNEQAIVNSGFSTKGVDVAFSDEIEEFILNPDKPNDPTGLTSTNAPDAVDDTQSTNEDTPITLAKANIVDPNDTDLDGDTLTITGVSNPVNGTVVLNTDGTVTFTPTSNFNGNATFDYTISDPSGLTDTATVTVAVGAVNDAPDAVDDTQSTNEDTPITLAKADIVDPNDTDLDGDTLTITGVSNPVNGTVVLNTDGTVTFTPTSNFNGNATFDYTISDPSGLTDTATVTVMVEPSGPTGGDSIQLTVDEALITNVDNTDNTLTFTAGATDLSSFKFDDSTNWDSALKLDTDENGTDDVVWTRTDTVITGSVNGQIAITLTLSASAISAGQTAGVDVVAELSNNFQHLTSSGANLLDLGDVKVIANDGVDNVFGTVNVIVIDDVIEITKLSNTQLTNIESTVGEGRLLIDEGEDGLNNLTFSGDVPAGLMTVDGELVHYVMEQDGSLKAVDETGDGVFLLSSNGAGSYTLELNQVLHAPLIDTTVSIDGTAVIAGSPVGSITKVTQNGVAVNLSATDADGADLINASRDGYGVDNGLVEEGSSEVAVVALDDPMGTFSNMNITVGNFSANGSAVDIFSYQLYKDGNTIGNVQNVDATANSDNIDTTISIIGSGFDEIRLWATHSGGNQNSEGSYKIISIDSDVTATSSEDVVLDFGVDVTDGDGDSHGGDFQIAIDTGGDVQFPALDVPKLDSLIVNDVVN